MALISTHEQILGGPTGQTYLGCRFPADASYRRELAAFGMRVGEVLRDRGVVSRFGVDFMALRDQSGEWRLPAIEINLRMGGTTGPFLALEFLTSGERRSRDRPLPLQARESRSTTSPPTTSARPPTAACCPRTSWTSSPASRIGFDSVTETGAVFHMIGSLSQFGKMGVTAIGDSPEQADAIYHRVIEVLDHAGNASLERGVRSSHPFDITIRSIE